MLFWVLICRTSSRDDQYSFPSALCTVRVYQYAIGVCHTQLLISEDIPCLGIPIVDDLGPYTPLESVYI